MLDFLCKAPGKETNTTLLLRLASRRSEGKVNQSLLLFPDHYIPVGVGEGQGQGQGHLGGVFRGAIPCSREPPRCCEGVLAPPLLPQHLPCFVHMGA